MINGFYYFYALKFFVHQENEYVSGGIPKAFGRKTGMMENWNGTI